LALEKYQSRDSDLSHLPLDHSMIFTFDGLLQNPMLTPEHLVLLIVKNQNFKICPNFEKEERLKMEAHMQSQRSSDQNWDKF
jgi:hypothetical protein